MFAVFTVFAVFAVLAVFAVFTVFAIFTVFAVFAVFTVSTVFAAMMQLLYFQVLELYSQRIGCSVERQQNFPGMVRKVEFNLLQIGC